MPDQITPEMLRDAYVAIHRLQDNIQVGPSLRVGLSQARIILASLYPIIVGNRAGDDLETIERL